MTGAIVPDSKKTAELVQGIASASREQSSGVEQIQKAMLQLDSVIQQNANSSEEMADMAEEFAGESIDLKIAIAYFKLGNEKAKSTDEKKSSVQGSRRQDLSKPALERRMRILRPRVSALALPRGRSYRRVSISAKVEFRDARRAWE